MYKIEQFPLPTAKTVTKYRCVQLLIPDDPDYINIFRGMLWGLTWWNAYQSDGTNAGAQASKNWYKTFDSLKLSCDDCPTISEVDDDMTIFRQMDCLLQAQCVDGSWVTIYDPSKCIAQGTTQPGPTTPPAAGECKDFIATLDFGGGYLLPVAVSSGDQIKVTNANGSWSSYLNDAPRWNCPDGNEFLLFGCLSGSATTSSFDPAPTFPHDALIAFDGTNYYDCSAAATVGSAASFIIAPGITDQKLIFLANNSSREGAGSVNFDVQICKKAAVFTLAYSFGTGPTTVTPGATVHMDSAFTGASDHISFTISPNAKLTVVGATGYIWSGSHPTQAAVAWTDPGGGSHSIAGGAGGSFQPTSFPPGTALSFFAVDDDQPVAGHPFSIDVLIENV
jgi:hypothetical protein